MYGKPVWMLVSAVILASSGASARGDVPRARSLEYTPGGGEWVEVPPPSPGTPEGDLYEIRRLVRDQKQRSALRAIKRFPKRHGGSIDQHPGLQLAKAEALIGLKNYYKAHELLLAFLDQFGGGSHTAEALRLEFVIAETFFTGVKRKFWGFRILSGEDIAYQILDDISVNFPNMPFAQYAIKTKADYLYANGEHAMAELEYARLLKEYPSSQYTQYALRRSAEAALASFAGVLYDDSALIEAEERYRDYMARYGPMAEREGVGLILANIHERRAEKAYAIGDYYERTDHLSSAVFYYQGVVQRWPNSTAARKAGNRLELLQPTGPVATASTQE